MDSPTTTPGHAPPDSLLTEAQAAAVLNIAPATLVAWRATKRAVRPAHCRIGGAVRYRRSDIEAFIEASIVQEAE
jgi:predicted DNA-binding transcriptional regulator AlpA